MSNVIRTIFTLRYFFASTAYLYIEKRPRPSKNYKPFIEWKHIPFCFFEMRVGRYNIEVCAPFGERIEDWAWKRYLRHREKAAEAMTAS